MTECELNQVKDSQRKVNDYFPASTTHGGKWRNKNVPVHLIRCEWKWAVTSLDSIRSTAPPPHHRPIHSLFFASLFLFLQRLGSPDEVKVMIYLLVSFSVCYGWTLMPIDTPFSILFTFPFFFNTFPQHRSHLTQSWFKGACKFIVSDILAKKENLWWLGNEKRLSP